MNDRNSSIIVYTASAATARMRAWAALDLMLTAQAISEARDLTRARHEFAGIPFHSTTRRDAAADYRTQGRAAPRPRIRLSGRGLGNVRLWSSCCADCSPPRGPLWSLPIRRKWFL